MSFVIAIDGPAAAGKGTLSKALAAHFGFLHLDTGLLYRAVGARVLAGEEMIPAASSLTAEDLQCTNLRTHEVAQAASKVAVNPEVRAALVAFQRSFAQRTPGTVLDGRDIGTVICPDANVKLFVTASAECRAQRRFDELAARGENVPFNQVLADMIARDERDASRSEAPLKAAKDAVLLDTSTLTAAQVLQNAIAIVEQNLN